MAGVRYCLQHDKISKEGQRPVLLDVYVIATSIRAGDIGRDDMSVLLASILILISPMPLDAGAGQKVSPSGIQYRKDIVLGKRNKRGISPRHRVSCLPGYCFAGAWMIR